MSRIPPEGLIGTLTSQNDLDLCSRQPRQVRLKQHAGVRERFLDLCYRPRELAQVILDVDLDPGVTSTQRRRRCGGALQFARPRRAVRKAYGERWRRGTLRGHGRYDHAGVESAAEERAYRHVREHLALDRAHELRAECRAPIAVPRNGSTRGRCKVYFGYQFASVPEAQGVSRHDLAYSAPQRTGGGNEAVEKELRQPVRRDHSLGEPGPQQGPDLGREGQTFAVLSPIEWLNTKRVAREDHDPSRDVIQREREHAVESSEPIYAPSPVDAEDYLCVRSSLKGRVARSDKLTPQLGVIIDLPIENDPDAPVREGHWLVTSGQVYDAEPTMHEQATRLPAVVHVGPVST